MMFRKLGMVVACSAFIIGVGSACGNAGSSSTQSSGAQGKALFEKFCMACHKDGGNIINPKKTLKKSDLAANGVKGADGIVKLMRNPGTGMTKYDKKTISDEQAKDIANYILSTY